MSIKYKSTVVGCYLSMVMQSFVISMTAVLFVGLRELYSLSYGQLGTLVLINFITQVAVDFICAKPVDKFGFRPFLLITPVLIVVGATIFLLAPLTNAVYALFIVGTIVFSAAGGLLEVVISPVIDNLPIVNKNKAMSMLHSVFGFGQIGVVVITSLLLYFFGMKNWQYIMGGWLVLPVIVFFIFLKAPVVNSVENDRKGGIRMYMFTPFFILCFFAIAFGGASEAIMTQWSSAFMEKSIGLPKLIGDISAVATFALALALGRFLYGKYGSRIRVTAVTTIGAALACICYVMVALVNINWVAVAACCVSGFAVSMLWPGTLMAATAYFPLAGAWIFAFLAGAGDIGSAFGPWLTGVVTDSVVKINGFESFAAGLDMTAEQLALKCGMLVGAALAFMCCLCNIGVHMLNKKKEQLGLKHEDNQPLSTEIK